MNRGGRREAFFEDEAHRQGFVQTLGEPSTKTGWQVHAVGKTRPICPLWRAIWTQAASCAAAVKVSSSPLLSIWARGQMLRLE